MIAPGEAEGEGGAGRGKKGSAVASPWLRGCAAAFAALALYAAGALEFLEHRLIELRFPFAAIEPDQSILLVKIDRASLDEIGVWPWPRQLHALAVDRLSAAGAAGISFDVDFSAHSDEKADNAFARAIARSRAPVRLAAFTDPSGDTDVGPIAPLLEAATPVNVNVTMEADARLWRFALRAPWRGGEIGALFAGLASAPAGTEPFWIDYGIDVEALPTLSFADIAAGRFDPEEVRGRQVIIGATAIELGDLVAAPVHGVLPGPVAQILAAQSVNLGRQLHRSGGGATAALTLVAALAASISLRRRRFDATLAGPFVVAAGTFLLTVTTQRISPVLLDASPALVATALAIPLTLASRAARLDMRLIAKTLALSQANRFMGRAADNVVDAIVTLDEAGEIQTRNRAASDIFRLPETDEPFPPEAFALWPRLGDSAALVSALERAQALGRRRRIICRRADGTRFYAEIAVSAFDDEAGHIWILLLRDISAEVEMERSARRRERLLRELKVRAEAATRTKTELVATMSHELRTPLNAIIGLSSMMREEALGPLGADGYRPMATEIHNSGARLLRLLTHVLDYANAGMDRLELRPEPRDLEALVREAVDLQRPRAGRAGVAMEMTGPATEIHFAVDPMALQKAIGNVLSNTIRFSGEEGRIRVAVRLELEGGAAISIEDDGPGMSAEFLARCLEPFEQADRSERRGLDGAGLGLTVARIFVEAHGGAFGIESEEGVGTKVTMRLPASRRCEAALPEAEPRLVAFG